MTNDPRDENPTQDGWEQSNRQHQQQSTTIARGPREALLGIDVGNTAISCALMVPSTSTMSDQSAVTAVDDGHAGLDGVRIIGELRLTTEAQHDESELEGQIRHFSADILGSGMLPERAVLCSVVPALTPLLSSTLLRMGLRVHEVRALNAREYGLSVDTNEPQAVGTDLIADCVAARDLDSAAIVDAGTATKVLSLQRGTFLGVTISPGPGLMGRALGAGTAQLPSVEPARPANVLGRDTISAMQSGIYYQALGGIRETLSHVLQTMPDHTVTILTGGNSHLFAGETDPFTITDPYFLHRGLFRIAQAATAEQWQGPDSGAAAD